MEPAPQCSALEDLQAALDGLRLLEQPVALVLDRGSVYVIDDVQRLSSPSGASAPRFLGQAYESGRGASIAQAVAAAYGARFLPIEPALKLLEPEPVSPSPQ